MKLTGKIVAGEGRGRQMSLPTINLDQHPEDLEEGVYAVWVSFDGERHAGAMNWGPRPTFGEEKAVMEVHLLDYEGNLYEQVVELETVERLRAVQKFETQTALIEQIQKDIAACRTLLL